MSLWRSTLRGPVKNFAYRFRNRAVYRLCSFYVNAVDNDHDSDFHTNGEAAFARSKLPGCAVAFDVGAARGDWTAIALEANPALQVHCFEPTSRRYAALVDRNFGSRAVLNKLALGDSSGEVSSFYGASGGSNSLFPQRYNGESYHPDDVETVKISTIDQYCREHHIDAIDFIKMDIEGYEMAALRGAEQMLRAGKISIVQFEYSHVFLDAGTSLKQLMEYIHATNPEYVFFKIFPDGARHVPVYEHALDNFKTQNWAFMKRSQ